MKFVPGVAREPQDLLGAFGVVGHGACGNPLGEPRDFFVGGVLVVVGLYGRVKMGFEKAPVLVVKCARCLKPIKETMKHSVQWFVAKFAQVLLRCRDIAVHKKGERRIDLHNNLKERFLWECGVVEAL